MEDSKAGGATAPRQAMKNFQQKITEWRISRPHCLKLASYGII
jgi:hypothetical protein